MKKLNKNYLCAVMYGIFGSLFFVCFIIAVANGIGGNHPYSEPFSHIAGIISVIVCLTVFCCNINMLSKEKRKGKIIFYELLIICMTFLFGIILWKFAEIGVSKFLVFMGW